MQPSGHKLQMQHGSYIHETTHCFPKCPLARHEVGESTTVRSGIFFIQVVVPHMQEVRAVCHHLCDMKGVLSIDNIDLLLPGWCVRGNQTSVLNVEACPWELAIRYCVNCLEDLIACVKHVVCIWITCLQGLLHSKNMEEFVDLIF